MGVATVSTTVATGVAVIRLKNPPVNVASREIRQRLLQALIENCARNDVAAIVLIGDGATFIAGSDISEFDGPIAEPEMPAVVQAIETCSKPVIAAIRGAALGGGCEIALACDGRIATPDAQVGFPEVTLGLIPGAGGTQRLPRLIGSARAIELITSGRRLPARAAVEIGLVDRLALTDLLESACEFAREFAGRKCRVSRRICADTNDALIAAAITSARERSRGSASVNAAIDMITLAGEVPFDEAIQRERAVFHRLRLGTESVALRRLFFAERRAARAFGGTAGEIASAGVVGLGFMGAGIALSLALAGLPVVVHDQDADALSTGVDRIHGLIERSLGGGRLTEAEADNAKRCIVMADDLPRLRDVDLVIEAVYESLPLKKEILGALDLCLLPGTILASNTSYLDIDDLAQSTNRPANVAGFHFFSPVMQMRLVEIIQASMTSEATLATLARLARRMRKVPIRARNSYGFIGNRINAAYRRQCEFLLEEGAYPETIDHTMTEFGMRMGPFAAWDLAGLDIAYAERRRLDGGRSGRARYVEIADRLVESGRLGRKSGAGWYGYSAIGKPSADLAVHSLIEALSSAKGIIRRQIDSDEISERALAAMVNEAALVVEENTAMHAGDVDLALVLGFGFPATKGGPLFWASRMPRPLLWRSIDRMAAASGVGVKRAANLDDLLDKIASEPARVLRCGAA